MKVYVWRDEVYPVYGIDEDSRGFWNIKEKVEIPDELYKRYKKIMLEYGEVQDELEKYSCG